MSETNEKQTETQPEQEICTMRIMFPVDSDEQAIACKKKIKAALSDIPDSRVEFSLMNMPVGPTNAPQIRKF